MRLSCVARRASTSAFIAFAAVAFGCGEPPRTITGTVPTTERTDSVISSSVIDISSGAGVLQLDPNTMILSDLEGHRVQLEGETQTVVLNTFDIMTVTDANVRTFASEPFPLGPGECSPSLGNCAESRLGPSPSPAGKRPSIDDAFHGRLKLRIDRNRPHPKRGTVPGVGSTTSSLGTGSGLYHLAQLTSPSPCYDIAVAIYEITQHYNALKSAWMYDVKGRISRAVTGTAQSGAPPTLSGTLSGLPVAMAEWYQDFMTAKVTLDQLAFHYSVNSCWIKKWQDRSSFLGDGFSPSGSGRSGFFMWTCTPIYIEIMKDGKVWWEGWGEECKSTYFPYGAVRADPTAGSMGSTGHERAYPARIHRALITV